MNKITWNREKLWQGCVLASIAHAINVAHYPEFAHEQSWDGFNYSVQDSSGTRGTITFHPSYLAAAFRNDNSERVSEYNNALEYFKDSPEEVKELAADETLQYLLEDIHGETVPVITTAFWGDGEGIYSQDEFDEMIDNGGVLLERQAMDIEAAINEWQEDSEMSKVQINLLKSIFQRKIEKPSEPIVLTVEEIKMIESKDEEGLAESRTSFKEIGIEWEV
ncbi:hypothetical protein LQV63_24080 [Paenibacillus profundus]|uniref:Uncharacterized protein n=1 Tax=Paenibacillus profundus TaxID=1173085 RepID=A0ABS8YRV8_9BACL|nr:hypothetical protein [Paenibacillus profundus]MCE5172359.1 hypothetical protein [Paenibacillus profundus]